MLICAGSRDEYACFHELEQNERVNIDYKTFLNKRNSEVVILAIHGGEIESGTSELATNLAEKGGYSSYVFEALKASSNRNLHITSTNFDDEDACNMVQKSNMTISIHGYRGEGEVVSVGGLDKALKIEFLIQLKKDGFSAVEATAPIAGTDLCNIVNKNKKKAGVQLELTTDLRKKFL
ncbi:poly-gamma-glutamate hydrolase family protein [Bacillus cereus]|uniref:poly-gamma-glutamate hydrolase family protein n=1 Tax=Bacillus cereus TaxID=1396 RepID=UPI0013D6F95E|nr:poly-gamma-glutamate hydrolase family protein [Bacillus cereus]